MFHPPFDHRILALSSLPILTSLQQWQVPKTKTGRPMANIEPGDCGIWVTCDKDKETKCTAEVRQLFEQVEANSIPPRLQRAIHAIPATSD